MSGIFTISLDFELHWGVRDKLSLEDYGENLRGVWKAVPEMLRLFEKYQIHTTWATVGLLFFDSKEELLAALPERKPAYTRAELSNYAELPHLGQNEHDDPYHYAPSLVRQILATPHQELASHTFSHYYCLEAGQTVDDFRADTQAILRVAREKFGVELKSLVFPRNQANPEYLKACADSGLIAYRGTEKPWFLKAASDEEWTLTRRGLRLVDSYINLSGSNSQPLPTSLEHGLVNIPASIFVRPWSRKNAFLEPLRLRRIASAMEYAARKGEIYHLWWHPHNFGVNIQENLEFLEAILQKFSELRKQGMQSLSMLEIAERVLRHQSSS